MSLCRGSSAIDGAGREGTARVTLFAANGIAQTFDYQPGDISYIPTAYGQLPGISARSYPD